MKLLLCCLLMVSGSLSAQVVIHNTTTIGSENVIGTASDMHVMVSKLTYDVSGTDTAFTFTIMKGKNTFIAEYQLLLFMGSRQVNHFYDLLKDACNSKEYKAEIDVNGVAVTITNTKLKGVMFAVISTAEGSGNISEKQLEQTFGRSK